MHCCKVPPAVSHRGALRPARASLLFVGSSVSIGSVLEDAASDGPEAGSRSQRDATSNDLDEDDPLLTDEASSDDDAQPAG